MQLPPTPTYKSKVDELEKYYKEGFREIVQLLRSLDPSDAIRRDRYEQLLVELSTILAKIDSDTKEWTETVILEAFEDSQARALLTLGVASTLSDAKTQITRTEITRDRSRQLIEDTFEDLLQATKHTERKVKKLTREIVADSMRQKAVKNAGYRENVKDVYQRLLDEGFSKSVRQESFIGIVDKAGRRWDLQTYSRMVVKTKIQQAQIEGARLEALERGSDLAVISSHGAKDACRHFEGMVVSLNGLTKGYRTLTDLRNSGLIFHPNCKHTVHPISSFDALPDQLKNRHEKRVEQAKEPMKNPKKHRNK